MAGDCRLDSLSALSEASSHMTCPALLPCPSIHHFHYNYFPRCPLPSMMKYGGSRAFLSVLSFRSHSKPPLERGGYFLTMLCNPPQNPCLLHFLFLIILVPRFLRLSSDANTSSTTERLVCYLSENPEQQEYCRSVQSLPSK